MLQLPSTKLRPTEITSRGCFSCKAHLSSSPVMRVQVRSQNVSKLETKLRSGLSSLLASFLNVSEDTINSFVKPPLPTFIDPKHVLHGNSAPVDELPTIDCEVIEGTLPSCLNGVYIRNGPNPQHFPSGPYHLLDGDGMLQCLQISDGQAKFYNHYVRTYRYNMENHSGRRVFPNMISALYCPITAFIDLLFIAARILSGQINPTRGNGNANTSLAFFGNRLFALGETDLPYALQLNEVGEIETVGRYDFNGELSRNMTAHPKVDPDTGETFAFYYSFKRPFLTYFYFDSNGLKQSEVPIFSLTQQSLIHDFAITKRYAIFPDIQMGVNLMAILEGKPIMKLDLKKVPRIGVIPRYAKDESEMKWFNVPGFNFIHAINAWEEEDDVIVLIAPNMLSIEHCLERMELNHASVEKVRIELKTGIITRFPLSARNLELGVINPAFLGKKSRYAYIGVLEPMPKIAGVVKLDLTGSQHQEHVIASRMFGHGCYGGEPFFVARNPKDPEADEDDGYIVTYVHDEILEESRFLVMDAKSPLLEIVAIVKLPQRVPYGFHGLFLAENDLKNL